MYIPQVEPAHNPLRHFTMMRRAIASSRAGVIELTGQDRSGNIAFPGNRMMDGRAETIALLRRALS